MLSSNPFALLDESENEGVAEVKPSPSVKPTAKQQQPKQNAPAVTQKQQPEKKSQGSVLRDRSNRKPVVDNTPFEEAPAHPDASKSDHTHRHGANAGRQASRGRDFDRKSGAGNYKHGDKKDVAGKGTWGDAIASELEAAQDAPEEDAEAQALAAAEEQQAKEREESLKTLEQFLAEQKKASANKEVSIRKPNEGADESQWKKLTQLKKENADFFVNAKPVVKERKVKEKPSKVVLEIEQRFNPPPRDSSSRGGREASNRGNRDSTRGNREGGSRGGRGGAPSARGSREGASSNRGRGGESNGAKRGGLGRGGRGGFNVNDESAFPSL